MGTVNFALENASSYFVINYEDSLVQQVTLHDLTEEIHSLNNNSVEWGIYDCDEYKLMLTNNRNYTREYLTSTDIDCNYAGIELQVTLIAFVAAGYYEGGNLDWLLLFNGDEYNSIQDGLNEAIEDSLFNNYINPGMAKIHKKRFMSRASEGLNVEVNRLETVYKKHCTNQMSLIGRSNNGEAFFEQVQS